MNTPAAQVGSAPGSTPGVAVVVPYYDQQHQLDLVLAALERQHLAPAEVVVADDGSPTPPVLGRRPWPVTSVRQGDKGFRASAARGLGARATSAPVLAFLDADTVPEPGYLAALARVVGDGPRGTLAVGRRRHGDLAGWTPRRLGEWFAGGSGPAPLDDPAWLADGYRATDDLRRADDRSYRYVISACMALPRELYCAAGGFDPGFVGYGGEDWDLAHRAWLAGADLRHVPDAVAWHDGPDLAGRADPDALRATKDAETLALAQVLTDPLARGRGLTWRYPHTVAVVVGPADAGTLVACADSLLAGADAGVWFPDATPPAALTDPRVHTGTPPPDVLQRARLQVRLPAAALVDGGLPALAEPGDHAVPGLGTVRVRRTRDLARGATSWDAALPAPTPVAVRPLDPPATLEARWAGWA